MVGKVVGKARRRRGEGNAEGDEEGDAEGDGEGTQRWLYLYWLGGTAHTDQQGALRAKERLRSTRSGGKTKATRRCPHFGDIASLCIEPGGGAFRLYEEKERERELPTGVLRPLTTRR